LPSNSIYATTPIATANGTNLICAVYSAAGALQGSKYSIANTLNSTAYIQLKLTNDGINFWLVNQSSAGNGIYITQIPTVGASTGVAIAGQQSATIAATTYALDAEVINGQLVVLAASSTTAGQCWMTFGLPDASLGINYPYSLTAATAFGTTAATTGSYWPRIMSGGGGLYTGSTPPTGQPTNQPTNGSFTAIFAYDHQNSGATYLGAQKFSASAIIGSALGNLALAANITNTALPVNPGPGSYNINSVGGTDGVPFNQISALPEGNVGVLFNQGVTFGSSLSGGLGAASATGVSSGLPVAFTTLTTGESVSKGDLLTQNAAGNVVYAIDPTLPYAVARPMLQIANAYNTPMLAAATIATGTTGPSAGAYSSSAVLSNGDIGSVYCYGVDVYFTATGLDGAVVVAPVLLATNSSGGQCIIMALSGGGFAVAYDSSISTNSGVFGTFTNMGTATSGWVTVHAK